MADNSGLGAPAEPKQPGTLQIGTIGGVAVLVRSSWLLIAALISVMLAPAVEQVAPGLGALKYVAGLAFAVLLYLSVLLHEMSHALMAKRFGLPVRSITLHFLGGVTAIEGEPDTPRREFLVSVVGPLTSLAVGGVSYLLLQVTPHGLLSFVVGGIAGANLVVGALNLVPGLPLDGGRVLRAAVWRVTGNPHRGTLVAGWAGRIVALAVFLFPVGAAVVTGAPPAVTDYLLALVIAWFLWSGATSAIISAKVRQRLPQLRARDLARRTLTVPSDLPIAEAVRRAREAQAGSIVSLDSAGHPTGIVSEAALLATPEERRPWLAVSAVSRTLEDGLTMPVDLFGERLILAMQRHPATEYLLLDADGSLFGVLVTSDVDQAFAASV